MLPEHLNDIFHHAACRKSRADEVILNYVVFLPIQQNAIGRIYSATGASDLLIICDHGSWALEVNHEAKIRFVESHAQRHRRDESLDPIFEQIVFGGNALVGFEV